MIDKLSHLTAALSIDGELGFFFGIERVAHFSLRRVFDVQDGLP